MLCQLEADGRRGKTILIIGQEIGYHVAVPSTHPNRPNVFCTVQIQALSLLLMSTLSPLSHPLNSSRQKHVWTTRMRAQVPCEYTLFAPKKFLLQTISKEQALT